MWYRVLVLGARATAKEQLELECTIEVSVDGEVWEELEGAPRVLVLGLSGVRAALRIEGSDADKRAGLIELIRTSARSLPALYGAVAIEAIEALLPAGWPVTVTM